MNIPKHLCGTMIALGLSGVASAQILVTADIATSTTWTAGNVYELEGEIHVLAGATLTIQPGTVIASDNPISGPAALVVCRGAMILANGTQTNPIVFTSKADQATWTGNNPKTGTYRQNARAEWGNLTICGRGYISENQIGTNTPAPNSANYAEMEGLLVAGLRNYGGGDDNDDSGSLSYVSLRYGGYIAGSTVELNGLSLGGVGRNTEIHHVEVLNNLDDGIEIWGGTVNLKYISIWNVGDDSFDVDQGWRGKAQFGLIVQGGCGGSTSGSGFGDNSLEIDGAELSTYQPVTTATIYNFTVIGNPSPTNGSDGGDQATAWRDNARVQIRNSIFMDTGEVLVSYENTDGENGNLGYGQGGTLTWANTWLTAATTTSAVNPFAAPEITPVQAYTAQPNGNLIDFRGNLFYNNLRPAAYVEATARGVLAPYAGNNADNTIATASPITTLTRGAVVTYGSNKLQPVTFLDPAPANDALTCNEWPLESFGFFDGARYRGAFGEKNNWLTGWTATDVFGLSASDDANVDLGGCRAGSQGCPQLIGNGTWAAGSPVTLTIKNLEPILSSCVLVAGFNQLNLPLFGGIVKPTPDIILFLTGAGGTASASWINPPGGSGVTIYTQALGLDFVQFVNWTDQFSFSNALQHLQP